MQHVPGAIYIDPRKSGLTAERDYTAWDLAGVERSDILFGYMAPGNPGGAGLAVEFGWAARASDKFLLLVEEDGYPQQRYFGMVRALADQVVTAPTEDRLDTGIRYLQTLVNQFRSTGRAAIR